ncbi:MAG TPA: NlpC/P60 family protein [Micromonosporaceae bacterium]
MSAPRVQKTRRGVMAAIFAVCAIALLPGTPAHAEPTVAEIEAQIAKIWNEAEPLIEKYNEIHEQYKKNKAKQAQLQKKIAPLQTQVDLGQARVGAMAAQIYKGGTADVFNAVVTSGSPGQLADQLSFVDFLARDQERQIEGVSKAKADLDAQKAPIDALVAQLAKQDTELAAKRKQIEAKLKELQALRIKAYGSSGGIGSFRPWPCPSEYLPTKGYKAAKFACSQAGKPYVWAASGPNSYDCSGLTLRSWAQVGVYLPHNAAMQRRSMPYVSRANLQIGDLVFYYSDLHHVAIYVGGGKAMSAPTFGDYVRMISMDVMPIHSFGRPG